MQSKLSLIVTLRQLPSRRLRLLAGYQHCGMVRYCATTQHHTAQHNRSQNLKEHVIWLSRHSDCIVHFTCHIKWQKLKSNSFNKWCATVNKCLRMLSVRGCATLRSTTAALRCFKWFHLPVGKVSGHNKGAKRKERRRGPPAVVKN
ncbi:unnamed protein product [Ceratitis capitata]|uniref:(Mediterranean fruit fly) hypothetical protein n=1 Tax=Ceratitis capitata TaxID=7213 RepID=A0A811V2Z9_CERCA|nr:unnamed protein product [Ceratitis capitata]